MTGSAKRVVGPDEFPLEEGHALEREHELITRLLVEESELRRQATMETGVAVSKLDLARTSAGREIAAGSPEASRDLLRALLPRVIHLRVKMEAIRASSKPPLEPHTKNPWNDTARSLRLLGDVVTALLRRKLPFEPRDIEALATWPLQPGPPDPWFYPIPAIVAAAKSHCGSGSPPPEVRRGLEELAEGIRRFHGITGRDRRDLLERIEGVLVSSPRVRLQPVEPWTVRALASASTAWSSRRRPGRCPCGASATSITPWSGSSREGSSGASGGRGPARRMPSPVSIETAPSWWTRPTGPSRTCRWRPRWSSGIPCRASRTRSSAGAPGSTRTRYASPSSRRTARSMSSPMPRGGLAFTRIASRLTSFDSTSSMRSARPGGGGASFASSSMPRTPRPPWRS